MPELEDHLKLRTPLVWVTCDEAPRVFDRLKKSTRPLYRLDPVEGLCRWAGVGWKKALIEDAQGQLSGTANLGDALTLATKEHGTLVLTESHKSAPQLTSYFSSMAEAYRNSIVQDDEVLSPAQIILISHEDEMPPEIRRICTRLTVGLPNATEIAERMVHLTRAADAKVPDDEEMLKLTRAAAGLSESELTTTTLDCLRRLGGLDVADINRTKLSILKQGGLLEVRTPKIGLDEVGGLDRAKFLVEGIAYIWQHPHETKEMGVEPLRRVLMVGLPGTGKSLMAEAAASALGIDLAKGGVGQVMNKFIGESEANMRKMFAQLKALAPVVFWIDEFGRDMSGGTSSNETDGGTTDRVHGEFLSGLQELPEDIFLIGAANRIDHLPPEMTRADRFDKVMFIGFPTLEERMDIFRIHLGKAAEQHDLEKLAGAAQRFTGAEIKALVREVRFDMAISEHRHPTTDDFIAAAPSIRGRVWVRNRKQVVEMYARARDEWEWASSAQEAEADEVLNAAKAGPAR